LGSSPSRAATIWTGTPDVRASVAAVWRSTCEVLAALSEWRTRAGLHDGLLREAGGVPAQAGTPPFQPAWARDLRDQIRSGVPMPTPRGKSPTAKLIPEPEDVPPLSAEKLELREKFGRAMGLR
jgi:hypothetical protein